MKPILEIQHISKKYLLHHQNEGYLSLRERMQSVFRFEKNQREDFWALNDVSFDVEPGDSLGIIGRNGAGKSTLLKLLSKITPPTKGRMISRGRVASLLEVGTGFHPELTGRENVFFNGSLLGMKKKEILAKFDEIVDFSGVEQFLDTQLKHYSSGMQLRLAFAVASFLEPEILIIDEVLAVGDAEFQRKCLGKMQDVSKGGRTILFVSHNLSAVKSLCKKAILLDKGRIAKMGTPGDLINDYLSSSFASDFASNGVFDLRQSVNKKYKGRGVTKATMYDHEKITSVFYPGSKFRIEFEFEDDRPILNVAFGLTIKDSNYQALIGINNRDLGARLNDKPVQSGKIVFEMESLPLYGDQSYYIDLYFGDGGNDYDTIENAITFKMEPSDVFGNGKILQTRLNTIYPGKVKMESIR